MQVSAPIGVDAFFYLHSCHQRRTYIEYPTAMKRTSSALRSLDALPCSTARTKPNDHETFYRMLNAVYRTSSPSDARAEKPSVKGILIEPGHAKEITLGHVKSLDAIRKVLGISGSVQWVPATQGLLKNAGFELWVDKLGVYNNHGPNSLATYLLGEQVHGGQLYGNVLVCGSGCVDECETEGKSE